jgi:hypothetical protein
MRLIRRPLLLLLFVGCFVSMEASGRLSIRLIADGAVSFAFVPVFGIVSLALVSRARARGVSFAEAVDTFFATDTAWLLWLVAMIAIRAVESPQFASGPPRPVFWAKGASMVPVALWTAWLDLRLFRSTLAPAAPVRAFLMQRLVAWSCALTYFFGIAVLAYIVGYAHR